MFKSIPSYIAPMNDSLLIIYILLRFSIYSLLPIHSGYFSQRPPGTNPFESVSSYIVPMNDSSFNYLHIASVLHLFPFTHTQRIFWHSDHKSVYKYTFVHCSYERFSFNYLHIASILHLFSFTHTQRVFFIATTRHQSV